MQISPGDAFLRNVSGSVAQPRPAPRQVPGTPSPPHRQARPAAASGPAAGASNSPPPVDRSHSVERVAQGDIPRDVPRGGIIDIQV